MCLTLQLEEFALGSILGEPKGQKGQNSTSQLFFALALDSQLQDGRSGLLGLDLHCEVVARVFLRNSVAHFYKRKIGTGKANFKNQLANGNAVSRTENDKDSP